MAAGGHRERASLFSICNHQWKYQIVVSENEGCQYLERDAAADKSGETCILLKKSLGVS